MGKNNSKSKRRTEFQKFESTMAKLNNYVNKEKALNKIREEINKKENEAENGKEE